MQRSDGFTLIETMVVVAILGIFAAVAMPNISGYMDKRRAISAAEAIYGQIVYARSEAIARSQSVYVRITGGNSDQWAVGVGDNELCDPTHDLGGTPCVLNVSGTDVLKRIIGTEHPGVSVATNTATVTFDPVRGTAAGMGTVNVTFGAHQLNVMVGILGRARICSPNRTGGYPLCA